MNDKTVSNKVEGLLKTVSSRRCEVYLWKWLCKLQKGFTSLLGKRLAS